MENALAFLTAFGLCAGTSLAQRATSVQERLDLIAELIDVVKDEYVDEADEAKLLDGAIQGMLRSLDPHCQWVRPEAAARLGAQPTSQFVGIGIQIAVDRDGVLTVAKPFPGTPAHEAGLRPGDRIVAVDGRPLPPGSTAQAVRWIRGPAGTQVTLTVMPRGSNEQRQAPITRASISVPTLAEYRMLDTEAAIGYVWITKIQGGTAREVDTALASLRKEADLRALVIDLRYNTGGPIESAADLVDRFLSDGLIATVNSRGAETMHLRAKADEDHPDIPLAVLINRRTAGGAEAVAAAIRDNARGVLIGTRTFGKASVQSFIPLADGSQVRLSTGRWLTPAGGTVDQRGVEPHIEVTVSRELEKQLVQQYRRRLAGRKGGEAVSEEVADPQITKAIEMLKEKLAEPG